MSFRPMNIRDVAYQAAEERRNIAPDDKEGMIGETEPHISSPSRKKWMLLAIYCVAQVRVHRPRTHLNGA
jgi:hypothetical protein